jgi:type II secretory pathway pseudopilin PulG
MKWILLFVVIVLSIITYNLQRSLDEERAKLQQAEAQVANLEEQIRKAKQQNPFLFPPPNKSGTGTQWKPRGTDLDIKPGSSGTGLGRGMR